MTALSSSPLISWTPLQTRRLWQGPTQFCRHLEKEPSHQARETQLLRAQIDPPQTCVSAQYMPTYVGYGHSTGNKARVPPPLSCALPARRDGFPGSAPWPVQAQGAPGLGSSSPQPWQGLTRPAQGVGECPWNLALRVTASHTRPFLHLALGPGLAGMGTCSPALGERPQAPSRVWHAETVCSHECVRMVAQDTCGPSSSAAGTCVCRGVSWPGGHAGMSPSHGLPFLMEVMGLRASCPKYCTSGY